MEASAICMGRSAYFRIRAPESTSSPGFATQLFFQVFFSIRRKVRRAGKYAGNTSAARGFQSAGLKRGGPLLALGRYGGHGISCDELIPNYFSTAATTSFVARCALLVFSLSPLAGRG